MLKNVIRRQEYGLLFSNNQHKSVKFHSKYSTHVDSAPPFRHLRALVVGQGNNCVKLWIGSCAKRVYPDFFIFLFFGFNKINKFKSLRMVNRLVSVVQAVVRRRSCDPAVPPLHQGPIKESS